MKKIDFVRAIAAQVKANGKADATQREVETYLDGIKSVIIEAMNSGEEIIYPGLIKFSVGDQAARKARNPITGEAIDVPAKKKVRVKVLGELKSSVQ